jgi:hypothetical protein
LDNISVRCRSHNVYESELVFGPFDASAVRETRENYAVSWGIGAVPGRRPAAALIRARPNPAHGATNRV